MVVRVLLVGLGSIGCLIGRFLVGRGWARVVGGVDVREDLVGRDLGSVLGVGCLGVRVFGGVDEALSSVDADVAVVATVSSLRGVYPVISELVRGGVNVLSTCEELVYPYVYDESLARSIDLMARKHGVTVLGSGINPGFLMDALVLMLTAPCLRIDRVEVTRKINASLRREPFQRKIGAGLSVEEFRRAVAEGRITGHVGLKASAALIASALNWSLTELRVKGPEPVIASKEVITKYVRVRPGEVAGVEQVAEGLIRDEVKLRLNFTAYVGAEEEYDSIVIHGEPLIRERIEPCVHGDLGTAGVVINLIPKVVKAEPGLKTMKDILIPHYIG